MNRNIVIAVVVLLLLGVGGYLFMNKQKGTSGGAGTETSGPTSLKDLLTAGSSQKCTYSTTDESGSTEGVSYISGGKVRTDFTTVASGKTTKSHMIVDGKTSYLWMDGEKTGYKTTLKETTEVEVDSTPVSQDTTTSAQGGMDLNQEVDYKCSGWLADSSYFVPPTDVNFIDPTQMFNPSAYPQQ